MGVQCFAQDHRNKHKKTSVRVRSPPSRVVRPAIYYATSLSVYRFDDGAKDIKHALPWYLFGHNIKANKVKKTC